MIDDCYLTIKDHPFNNVMKNYIDSKLDNSLNPLPQVIISFLKNLFSNACLCVLATIKYLNIYDFHC